jgi:hypothetical protein
MVSTSFMAGRSHSVCAAVLNFPVAARRATDDFIVFCFIEHDEAARHRGIEVFFLQPFEEALLAASLDDDIARIVGTDGETDGGLRAVIEQGETRQHDGQTGACGEQGLVFGNRFGYRERGYLGRLIRHIAPHCCLTINCNRNSLNKSLPGMISSRSI